VLIIIAGRDAEIIKVSVQDVNSPCRPHPPPDLIEKGGKGGKNMDRRDFAQIAPQKLLGGGCAAPGGPLPVQLLISIGVSLALRFIYIIQYRWLKIFDFWCYLSNLSDPLLLRYQEDTLLI